MRRERNKIRTATFFVIKLLGELHHNMLLRLECAGLIRRHSEASCFWKAVGFQLSMVREVIIETLKQTGHGDRIITCITVL